MDRQQQVRELRKEERKMLAVEEKIRTAAARKAKVLRLHKEYILVYKGPIVDSTFMTQHFAKTLPAISAMKGAMIDTDTYVIWLKFAKEIRYHVVSRALNAHNIGVVGDALRILLCPDGLVASANRIRLTSTDLYMRISIAKTRGCVYWDHIHV